MLSVLIIEVNLVTVLTNGVKVKFEIQSLTL